MKKIIVIIFIVFASFLTFSLYRTFAYYTSVVEEVPSTTDLEYTFKIGNSSIKQITVDSGETRYYDIVLGNPNNAKISYSVYYEMVSPSSKPDDYKIEYTSKSTGNSTGIVNNNGNITLNIVVTNTSSNAVTVKLGTVAGYVKGGELTLGSGQELIPKQPANFVEKLDDGTTGDSGSGVYKVHHDAIPAESSVTEEIIPAIDDYRYYGTDPNNYICLDKEGQSTCPIRSLFRIIGSIYEENAGTNLIKIVTVRPLMDDNNTVGGTFAWDYKSDGTYSNIWSYSINGTSKGSTLMQLLNNAYLTSGSSNYYNGSTTAITVDFTSEGLTENARKLMNTGNGKKSKYYLGLSDGETVEERYLFERTKQVEMPFWDGDVALMYPSDYGYASGNKCSTSIVRHYNMECNNWLRTFNFIWTMSSQNNSLNDSVCSIIYGDFSEARVDSTRIYGHPVFYLKSDITLIGGTGTETDPYLVQ